MAFVFVQNDLRPGNPLDGSAAGLRKLSTTASSDLKLQPFPLQDSPSDIYSPFLPNPEIRRSSFSRWALQTEGYILRNLEKVSREILKRTQISIFIEHADNRRTSTRSRPKPQPSAWGSARRDLSGWYSLLIDRYNRNSRIFYCDFCHIVDDSWSFSYKDSRNSLNYAL